MSQTANTIKIAAAFSAAISFAAPAAARDKAPTPNNADECIVDAMKNLVQQSVVAPYLADGQSVSLTRTTDNMVGAADACADPDNAVSSVSDHFINGFTATLTANSTGEITPLSEDEIAPADMCLRKDILLLAGKITEQFGQSGAGSLSMDANAVKVFAMDCEKKRPVSEELSGHILQGFTLEIAPYEPPAAEAEIDEVEEKTLAPAIPAIEPN